VSEVIYGGAPPELTGLPHPIHHYGPCKHRFQPAAVLAAEAAQRERAEEERAARAKAEAEEEARRDESIEVLSQSSDPDAILAALRVREGSLPPEIVKGAWLRLLEKGLFAPEEEMLTVEGRGTVLGYFLSRGGYTTQWGKWVERKREPVYRAPGAGLRVTPSYYDVPGTVQEGFDVWFDAAGELWSDGGSSEPARLAIGGTGRAINRLILPRGMALRLQRRKANWIGWEIRVPGSRGAWAHAPGSAEYTRALRSVLEHRSA
jgi:hypothetical protein